MNKYLFVFLLQFVFFSATFIYSQKKNNNGYIDIAWGLGFIISSLSSFLMGEKDLTSVIVTSLCFLWALRLSYHLFKRNFNKKEDYRYRDMRNKWKNNFYLKMYFNVYMLQLVLNFLIAFPIMFINFNKYRFDIFSLTGVLVWIFGFYFEIRADYELKKHSKKDTILDTGLWKLSRHPNYFGESLMWWGFFIISKKLIFIFSPLIITIFLLKISIPLLEKRLEKKKNWHSYKKTTPIFIPKLF